MLSAGAYSVYSSAGPVKPDSAWDTLCRVVELLSEALGNREPTSASTSSRALRKAYCAAATSGWFAIASSTNALICLEPNSRHQSPATDAVNK